MRKGLLLLFLCFGMSASVLAADAVDSAADIVESATISMIAAIHEEEDLLQRPERLYALAEEHVLLHFDFVKIGRLALGKHWRKADNEQKLQFIKAFRQLLVRTYADAMLEYADQKITYLPTRASSRPGRVTVRSEVDQPDGSVVSINYDMYKDKNGAWRIYGVTMEGVNLVINYRSSFTREIRKSGLNALIKKIEQRNIDADDE